MIREFCTTRIKSHHLLIVLLIPVISLSLPPAAGAQMSSAPAELILDYDITGIWGLKAVVWRDFGIFGGLRSALTSPKGQRSAWSKHRAEDVELSEFTGYSKDIIFGLNLGCAYGLLNNKVVISGGLNYLRIRKFRQYFDEDLPGRGEWAENYYIVEGRKQKQKIGLQIGTYLRMENVLLGLAFNTDSKGFALCVGWPVGTGLSLGDLK